MIKIFHNICKYYLLFKILTCHVLIMFLSQLLPDPPSPLYPPNFLFFLSLFFLNPSSPMCWSNPLSSEACPRVGSTNVCHTLKENQLLPFQQLSNVNSNSARGGTWCHFICSVLGLWKLSTNVCSMLLFQSRFLYGMLDSWYH